jgi:hypothetical protein
MNKGTIRNTHRKLVFSKMEWALSEVAKSMSMTKGDLIKYHPHLKVRAYELARSQSPSFRTWAKASGHEDLVLEADIMGNQPKRPRPKTYKKGGDKKVKK